MRFPPFRDSSKVERALRRRFDLTSIRELAWGQMAKRAVRTTVIVVVLPSRQRRSSMLERRNSVTFRHSSRRRPLNDSISPFSTGLPGRMKSSCTPLRHAHSSRSFEVNSLP